MQQRVDEVVYTSLRWWRSGEETEEEEDRERGLGRNLKAKEETRRHFGHFKSYPFPAPYV